MTSHVAWRELPPRSRRAWSRWRWRVCAPSSTERARRKSYCEPFGSCLIQAPRPSMIWRPRLPPHGCRCAIRAPSTGGHRSDLPPRHERGQRFDEGSAANRELDGRTGPDRKSTRLNSSHRCISYAVFCLKKKKLLSAIPTGCEFLPLLLRSSAVRLRSRSVPFVFFLNDTAPPDISTLPLPAPLPF